MIGVKDGLAILMLLTFGGIGLIVLVAEVGAWFLNRRR